MNRESIFQSDSLDADWLPDLNIIYYIYKGELIYEASQNAYKIGGQMIAQYGIDSIHGIIGDFRQVTKFPNTNITSVQKESKKVNKEHDMSSFGVALFVKNMMQETFVKVTTQVSGTEHRSQVVYSLDEAFKFLTNYREQHAKQENAVSDDESN